jgi:hypothetical protein
LQDKAECSESILCVCTDCFFGNRCQFYAKGIGLTLDDMLRYAIQPNIAFINQSIIVQFSAAFIMFFFVAGLLNSLPAFLVFRHPNCRQNGTGMYLHVSSIVSGIAISILAIKFWFVVITHIYQSVDRRILLGGCISIEIALQFCLHITNWLNACVSIERVITVIQGIHFNKSKSKLIARWLLRLLPVVILGSLSHEFIYRSLFDDYEEQRVWCVFHYSELIQKYSTVIQLFHFIVPFAMNLFSAVFIVFTLARRRAEIQTRQRYAQQLLAQLKKNKQLIVSSTVLVILSVSRL